MFGGMDDMMQKMQMMQKMMQDENFRNFVSHPKVQGLFKDPEFKEVAKTRDFSKIAAYPKFAALMQDPEVAPLMAKINAKDFLSNMG